MDTASIAAQIAEYDKTRKSSNDVLNDAMTKYGIPEIRSRVSGLRTTLSNTENALNAVDPSVTGRTSRSLVTEAQRQAQVNNERAPIAEQYGQQSRALSTESANQNDALQAAKLLAENQINDYNTGRQALTSRYDIANSQEMERRRREEADRTFRLQESEAKRAAAALAGYNIGGGGGGASAPAAASTDLVQQKAFNDAYTRLNNESDAAVISDIRATAKSAGFGNVVDQAKLEVYKKYRPDLFAAGTAPVKTAAAPTATPSKVQVAKQVLGSNSPSFLQQLQGAFRF
jgi:hypothetical protein